MLSTNFPDSPRIAKELKSTKIQVVTEWRMFDVFLSISVTPILKDYFMTRMMTSVNTFTHFASVAFPQICRVSI